MRKRRKPIGISMVERAIIAQRWQKDAIDAHIHAFTGENSDKLVDLSGRMFYVALGAAVAAGLDPESSDIRIIRGAVNAVYDQAGQEEIQGGRRASILSGLQACARVAEKVSAKDLTDAACDMELRLRAGHVMYSDFEKVIAAHESIESTAAPVNA